MPLHRGPQRRFARAELPPRARQYAAALDRAMDPSAPPAERATANLEMRDLANEMRSSDRPRRRGPLGEILGDALDHRSFGQHG